jgi:hypothetical protein
MENKNNKILFLGDSITRHYFKNVNELLSEYEIDSKIPHKNVSQQQKQIKFIKRNLFKFGGKKSRMDVNCVHFNFGLHSIKLPNKGHDPNFKRALPVWFERYENELIEQIKLLKRYNKKIFFSNTTLNPKNAGMRNNDDVKKLNDIAKNVTEKYNVPYNDLYSHIVSKPNYHLLYRHPRRENNCHFNPLGCKFLANIITKFIVDNL